MSDELWQVASLAAGPGQRISDSVTVSITGIQVRLPLFLINGAHTGPTLAITAGIHGAEYASIEAALRLGRNLDPAALRGRVVIAPVANPPAFTARSIYVSPPDGKNLNRQFPGFAKGTFSQALAYWLFEEVIRRSDAFVDLHGGDLIEALEPFVIHFRTGNPQVDQASADLARSFGIRYVVAGDTPGSTYGAAAQIGIPGLLAEAGGQGIWTEETANLLYAGVLRVMAHLGMTDAPPTGKGDAPPTGKGDAPPMGKGDAPPPPAGPPIMLQRWEWLRSAVDGFFYPTIKVGDRVRAGQDLGCVADVNGAALQSIQAPIDGIVLFLVTSLAMNAGDPLLAVGA